MAVKDRLGRFVRAGQAPAETVPEPAPAEPVSELAQVEAMLTALDNERAAIAATLEQHRSDREAWLRDGGSPPEDNDGELRQRLAALEHERVNLTARRALLAAEERRQNWARWRQQLLATEIAACDHLDGYKASLKELSQLRAKATGASFGYEVQQACVPPPVEALHPYAAGEFHRIVRLHQARREGQAVAQPQRLATPVDPAANWLPAEPPTTFWPRAVPTVLMEQISAIGPPRQVRILHGCRTDGVWPSQLRVKAGDEMWAPPRTAWALVYAGAAEYCDGEPPPTVSEPVAERETAA